MNTVRSRQGCASLATKVIERQDCTKGADLMNTQQNLTSPFTDEEHREWRRSRANEQQRQRRKKYRRVDYYLSEEAAAVIDAETHHGVCGDYSSVINRIVTEWASKQRKRSGIK